MNASEGLTLFKLAVRFKESFFSSPAFPEIGNFFVSHGSQFESHDTPTAANSEKFLQVYMKKKLNGGGKPKPPKTLDFTPLPSLLRKISLLFMW